MVGSVLGVGSIAALPVQTIYPHVDTLNSV
jgi:hypothetical protein